ncbi:hypothetical protein BC834DRAFT_888684 [Gloeopeniophorella convolvens]|nr:hypothetical protein BC834DRAFT_888684 [Gloeopeniophorella convolvens]
MFVFATVNSRDHVGYCIAQKCRVKSNGLPKDLQAALHDVILRGDRVEAMSIGLYGYQWFLRSDTTHAYRTAQIEGSMNDFFAEYANSMHEIRCFAFAPDPTGYVAVVCHRGDHSTTECKWHNVPPALDALLMREAHHGVRHVTMGNDDSYVVLMESGTVWTSGIPDALRRQLDDAAGKGRQVLTVSLSLAQPDRYFVEFGDGYVDFGLPARWHRDIEEFVRDHPSEMNKKVMSLNRVLRGFITAQGWI